MNVTIARQALLTACAVAARVLPERPLGPAESHFLLETGEGTCFLSAADGELFLRLRLPVRAEPSGQALLNARAVLAVLRAVTADELALEGEADRVVLRAPGARFQLEAPSPAIFPLPERFPTGPCLRLDSQRLRRVVHSTLFAAGPGSKHYCLEGVLCEVEPGRLRLIASDNRRLAVAQMPAEGGGEDKGGVLPARAVALLARLATEAQVVEAAFRQGRACFRTEQWALSVRCVEGSYPPWRSVVPASAPCSLEVPVAGLLGAVRQAAVLREQVGARLLLRLEPGRLVLESGRVGSGQSRVARRVPFAGGPVEVVLDPRFVLELLRCLEGEQTVRLGLTDADTPVLFQSGESYTHVLMPLHAP